jgi:hypothetical protein
MSMHLGHGVMGCNDSHLLSLFDNFGMRLFSRLMFLCIKLWVMPILPLPREYFIFSFVCFSRCFLALSWSKLSGPKAEINKKERNFPHQSESRPISPPSPSQIRGIKMIKLFKNARKRNFPTCFHSRLSSENYKKERLNLKKSCNQSFSSP